MEPIAFNDYQTWCLTKLRHQGSTELDRANAVIGLSGETGEVAEIVKKSLFHGNQAIEQNLTEEIGDVLYYLAVLALHYGLALDDIVRYNVKKLDARYPKGTNDQ